MEATNLDNNANAEVISNLRADVRNEAPELCTEHLWHLLLLKNPAGQTLMGLLEATAVKLDRKHHYTARVPEIYATVQDMVYDGISKFEDRKVLENFDSLAAGGLQNLPGYLAARWTGIVMNAAQDALRKKSIRAETVQDEAFLERQAKRLAAGKKALLYVPAIQHGSETTGAQTDHEGQKEAYHHGSTPSEWAGRCDWDIADPQATDALAASSFRENILFHLTDEESALVLEIEQTSAKQAAARLSGLSASDLLLARATVQEAATLLGCSETEAALATKAARTTLNQAEAHTSRTLKSARSRLAKAGVTAKLALKGRIV